MSVKDQALSTLRELPGDATWEDIEDRIRFLATLDRAQAELDQGRGIPHETVQRQVATWFQK